MQKQKRKAWISNGRISPSLVWLCEDCLEEGKRTELRPNKTGAVWGLCEEHVNRRVGHFWEIWESEQSN